MEYSLPFLRTEEWKQQKSELSWGNKRSLLLAHFLTTEPILTNSNSQVLQLWPGAHSTFSFTYFSIFLHD